MNKENILRIQKDVIINKFNSYEPFTEYDYVSSDNSVISRCCDEKGKTIGFITTWEENNMIRHHIEDHRFGASTILT